MTRESRIAIIRNIKGKGVLSGGTLDKVALCLREQRVNSFRIVWKNRKYRRKKKESNDMENYSKSEILQMVEEEDVEFIRLQFTDMFGVLKMWRSQAAG